MVEQSALALSVDDRTSESFLARKGFAVFALVLITSSPSTSTAASTANRPHKTKAAERGQILNGLGQQMIIWDVIRITGLRGEGLERREEGKDIH